MLVLIKHLITCGKQIEVVTTRTRHNRKRKRKGNKKMFAKLYETGEGQILVRRGRSEDNGPCIFIHFDAGRGVIGDVALVFANNDTAFDEMTEENVVKLVKGIKAEYGKYEEDSAND